MGKRRVKKTVERSEGVPLSQLTPAAAWIMGLDIGGSSSAGERVNSKTALNVPAVFAAVQVISQDVAKLKFEIVDDSKNDYQVLNNHPLNRLLNKSPNSEMTAISLWEFLISQALIKMGGYAIIDRDVSGKPIALRPIEGSRTEPVRAADGRLVYRYKDEKGNEEILEQIDVIHIKPLTNDGICGLDVINLAKNVIGNALAAYKFSGKFFENGTNTSGYYTTPNKLDDKSKEALKKNREYKGADNAFKTQVFDNGITFNRTGIDPDKAQMLESMKFSGLDVCKYFRIPPHKIGILDGSNYSTTEEANQMYVDETLSTWSERVCQEVERKLLLPSEVGRISIHHSFANFIKGSAATADYYGKLWQYGFVTQNEVARKLHLPQIGEDGDKYYITAQVVPQEPDPEAMEPADPIPAPAPSPEPVTQPGDGAAARALGTHTKLLSGAIRRLLKTEQDKVQRFSKTLHSEFKIKEYYDGWETELAERSEGIREVLESLKDNTDLKFNPHNTAIDILKRHMQLSKSESIDLNKVDSWLGTRAVDFAKNEISQLVKENK